MKPFGHAAIVERRPYGKADFTQTLIRRRGSRSAVERAARLLSGFRQIISVEAYTKEEWIRSFGWGSEHGTPPL